MESNVLELVVFRLREGVSGDELLGTVAAESAWIARQPGFVSRELCLDAEGHRWNVHGELAVAPVAA